MGRQPYIANVATTVLGVMYCAFLPLHVLLTRQIGASKIGAFEISANEGLFLVVLVFLTVIATDVGGYYFGRKFGKKKLSPVISPSKTVEGSLGATGFALVVACLGTLCINFALSKGFISLPDKDYILTVPEALVLGLLIAIAAQLGDLSESLIKRDAGVKDSGTTLPGHGGFLDRTDSFVFALPVAYYYLISFTQGNNVVLEFFAYAKGFLNAYF
jgi:phosphatidate cytidylyltransferase